jgi:hypothetical protein
MAKESLTREEMETIINFNRAEPLAEVYTHEPRLLTRLRKIAEDFPDVCALIDRNDHGGETYSIPKKLIRIGMPMSEERREAARLKASHLGKNPGKNPL